MGAENSAPKRFKILYPRCFPPQSLRASDGFIKFAQNALHDRPPISRPAQLLDLPLADRSV